MNSARKSAPHRRPVEQAIALLCALAFVGGCQAKDAPAKSSPEPGSNHTETAPAAGDVKTRLEALKVKTLKDLVFVQGGGFKMGDFGPIHNEEKLPYSGNTDDDELHEVVLDSYSILAHKVTYADFDVYTDSTGKPRVAMEAGRDKQYRGLAGIAAGVDWNDARAYCQWIGQQINLPMDVPTEAQWEYAARNRGKMVVYPTDNGKIDNGRNVASLDQAEEFQSAHNLYAPMLPVGRYPATPLGLYDVIDGGYEWTRDWYAPQYNSAKAHNPLGAKNGTEKVLRGYSTVGGDTLQQVSMTVTRNKKPASPPRSLDMHDQPIVANQNRVNTIRCVVNSAKRAEANR